MKDRIRQILKDRLHFENVDIDDQSSIRETLGLDSVDFLELVIGLEQEFKIKIEDAEICKENFHSIENIEHYIKNKGGK